MNSQLENNSQPLYLQELDASRFTPAELKLIHSAVSHYINDVNIEEIKASTLNKIEREISWRTQLQPLCNCLIRRTSLSDYSEINIVVRDVNSPPLFKFASCPESVRISDIVDGPYLVGPQYTFSWLPSYYDKGRGNVRLSYNDSTFLLSDLDIELLFAFYLYHSLIGRGVTMSGIPFTAPATEGESKGEEASSSVHSDARRS